HRVYDALSDCLSLGRASFGKQDGEFITAGTRAASVRRRRLARGVRHEAEHLVAGEVAVEVVDALEMVEVQDEEYAGSNRERIIQCPHQLTAVGEPGRGIRVGVAVG